MDNSISASSVHQQPSDRPPPTQPDHPLLTETELPPADPTSTEEPTADLEEKASEIAPEEKKEEPKLPEAAPRFRNKRTYKFCVYPGNHPLPLRQVMKSRGNWQEVDPDDAIENAHFIFRPVNFGYSGYSKMDNRLKYTTEPIVFNHFEVLKGICTKTGLIKSLKAYYDQHPEAIASNYTVFDTTPTTFVVSVAKEDCSLNTFIYRFKEISKGYSRKERVPLKHCEENIWLIKPESANQGRGIEIYRNIRDIQSYIFSQPVSNQQWVIQKYIEKPLLYKQRKFDIRIWSLVTNSFEIYIFKHGYLRTSSNDYSLQSKNNYVHLTNQCLQNKSETYAQFEAGNTLNYAEFQKFLDEEYPDRGVDVQEHFIPRIQDIIIDTFLSVRNTMNPNKRKDAFELFGFDFLIDEDFRVWLIEVNTNPYLGMPNKYIEELIPKMLDDMARLVVDPIYQPLYVDSNHVNDFEILYREEQACTQRGKIPVNKRRPFALDLCYPFPELKPVIGMPFHQKHKKDILYSRARHNQKMVNISGLNKSILSKSPRKLEVSRGLIMPPDKPRHSLVGASSVVDDYLDNAYASVKTCKTCDGNHYTTTNRTEASSTKNNNLAKKPQLAKSNFILKDARNSQILNPTSQHQRASFSSVQQQKQKPITAIGGAALGSGGPLKHSNRLQLLASKKDESLPSTDNLNQTPLRRSPMSRNSLNNKLKSKVQFTNHSSPSVKETFQFQKIKSEKPTSPLSRASQDSVARAVRQTTPKVSEAGKQLGTSKTAAKADGSLARQIRGYYGYQSSTQAVSQKRTTSLKPQIQVVPKSSRVDKSYTLRKEKLPYLNSNVSMFKGAMRNQVLLTKKRTTDTLDPPGKARFGDLGKLNSHSKPQIRKLYGHYDSKKTNTISATDISHQGSTKALIDPSHEEDPIKDLPLTSSDVKLDLPNREAKEPEVQKQEGKDQEAAEAEAEEEPIHSEDIPDWRPESKSQYQTGEERINTSFSN